jgi:hypothetical protein
MKYQGHRSWNAWNVSLWIANDELLYRAAVRALRTTGTFEQNVDRFYRLTGLHHTSETPDGAVYNRACVREALAGLEIQQEEHAA